MLNSEGMGYYTINRAWKLNGFLRRKINPLYNILSRWSSDLQEELQTSPAAYSSYPTGRDEIPFFLISPHLLDHSSRVTENKRLSSLTEKWSLKTICHISILSVSLIIFSDRAERPLRHQVWDRLIGQFFREAFTSHSIYGTYPCFPL